MEIIGSVIQSLLSLTSPIPMAYSIVNNLPPSLEEMLGSPSFYIAGIYKPDFDEESLKNIYDKISTVDSNLVFCDLDTNNLIITNNKEMNKANCIPINRIKALIDKIGHYTNVFDHNNNVSEYSYIINM